MKEYLVVGVYESDYGRFATSVVAPDPETAEDLAKGEAAGPLIIAAVIEGNDLKVVA